MNNRFGSGAVAVLTTCIVAASSLSVINASASSAGGGPHFRRVAALTAGAVSVKKLPRSVTHAHGLHPFRPVSALNHASRPAAVPVVMASGIASRTTLRSVPIEQVLTTFMGVIIRLQDSCFANA